MYAFEGVAVLPTAQPIEALQPIQPAQSVKSFETFETFGLFTDGGGGWGDPPLAEAGGGQIRVED